MIIICNVSFATGNINHVLSNRLCAVPIGFSLRLYFCHFFVCSLSGMNGAAHVDIVYTFGASIEITNVAINVN